MKLFIGKGFFVDSINILFFVFYWLETFLITLILKEKQVLY